MSAAGSFWLEWMEAIAEAEARRRREREEADRAREELRRRDDWER